MHRDPPQEVAEHYLQMGRREEVFWFSFASACSLPFFPYQTAFISTHKFLFLFSSLKECLKFYKSIYDMEIKIKWLSFLSSFPFHSFEFMACKAFPSPRLQRDKVGEGWSLLAQPGTCLTNMPWGDVSITREYSFNMNTEVMCLVLKHHIEERLLVTVRTLLKQ